tara:strand:- start:259 stop:726 length:468 start_codon:yes stop_codon:yes gene_type:complete
MKVNESRVYVVPLRKRFVLVPRWRRSKQAMKILKAFILKHTKADRVIVSGWINEEIWKHGGKNPPGKLKVKVILKEEEIEVKGAASNVKIKAAHVDLDTLPAKAARVKKKAEKKLTLKEKLKAKLSKKEEVPAEEVVEEKKKAKVTKEQELKMNK